MKRDYAWWAKMWILITNILLFSAVCGVPFGFMHGVLAGACAGYGILVWRAINEALKAHEARDDA